MFFSDRNDDSIQLIMGHFPKNGAAFPVLRALHDVLLAAASRLHHLIDRAVAILGQEPLAEDIGHLVEYFRLLV